MCFLLVSFVLWLLCSVGVVRASRARHHVYVSSIPFACGFQRGDDDDDFDDFDERKEEKSVMRDACVARGGLLFFMN